jgi:hypothetical protein
MWQQQQHCMASTSAKQYASGWQADAVCPGHNTDGWMQLQ